MLPTKMASTSLMPASVRAARQARVASSPIDIPWCLATGTWPTPRIETLGIAAFLDVCGAQLLSARRPSCDDRSEERVKFDGSNSSASRPVLMVTRLLQRTYQSGAAL